MMSEIDDARLEIEVVAADLQALLVGFEVRYMNETMEALARAIARLEEARRMLCPEAFLEEVE